MTVVRNDHPLLSRTDLAIGELADAPWIVPPLGSILRHRFDLMFREAGFDAPRQVIETVSPMVATRLLEETDFLAVLPVEVAQYYASCALIAILGVALSCNMDSYGVITRKSWLLSPAAKIMHQALLDSLAPRLPGDEARGSPLSRDDGPAFAGMTTPAVVYQARAR